MSKKLMVIILIQVLLIAGGIIWYQQRTISEYQVANKSAQEVYEDACVSCHPVTEFAGRSISVGYTKSLIREGKGVMPKYPGIQEPDLTELAEYVNQLKKE